jgi:universal stress protein A
MFRNILVPIDLTDKHQPAVDAAAKLAEANHGSIELLHVIETIAGLPMEEEKTFYERLERVARKHLDKWGRSLAQRGLEWRAEVVFGPRSSEVVRRAEAAASDLIVLTVPRVMPDQPVTSLGSLGYKVGLLAQCPVLLVK